MTHASIMFVNADLPLCEAVCLGLLMSKDHRDKVGKVYATIHDIDRPGVLGVSGAELIQMGNDPKEDPLIKVLGKVDCCVLSPDWTSEEMVNQARCVINCASKAKVKQFILHSRVGIEDIPGNKTAQKYLKIEQMLHDSKLKEVSIVRLVPCQQDLFEFRPMMKENKLCWSCKPDAHFTLVNFTDCVAFVISEIIGQRRRQSGSDIQIFRLTGQSLFTGQRLCKLLNDKCNLNVKFQQISRDEMNDYLMRELMFNQCTSEAICDGFEMINSGKLNHVSDDMKKVISHEPVKLDKFLEEHSKQFQV